MSTNKNPVMDLWIVGIATFAFALFMMYFLSSAVDNRARRHVLEVCNTAHKTIDGPSEQKCGELQDKYHAEYKCTSKDPEAYCWVELQN